MTTTIEYNGLTVTTDSQSVIDRIVGIALQNQAAEVALPNYAEPNMVAKVEKAVTEKRNSSNSSAAEHVYACGHSGPKTRGRYSVNCPDCTSENTDNVEEATQKPKSNSKARGGYRGVKREFDTEKFLASEKANEPISSNQFDFIMRLLGEMKSFKPVARKVSKSAKKEILDGILEFTKGQAASLISELLALPLA